MRKQFLAFFLTFVCINVQAGLLCIRKDKSIVEILKDENYKLMGPFTVEELEKRHTIKIKGTGELIPFGGVKDEWNELKSRLKKGDEIHYLARIRPHFWGGYVLVRDQCIIYTLVMRIN